MKKVLIIEDNNDIRENTSEILELANYKVFAAANGKLGIAMALEHKPDIVICDIMMPELDGYGVLHALQKNEAIKNIPFIFLTAKTERTDFRKGMELGADDYITKPFDGTELLRAVDSRLKKIASIQSTQLTGIEGVSELINTISSKEALQYLTDNSNSNTFKKKQIIYAEGNHPLRLYYVVNGKVKLVKSNDDGKELIIELCKPGDFFGHIALIKGSTYNDNAIAIEDCEIAMIPKDEFEKLLNSNYQVAQHFIKLLANNIASKEAQLLGMAYNSLRKKVAEALLMIYRKYDTTKEVALSIDISRENLATIAGTATESLIRTLSDFKNEKLIEIENGNIKILNFKKLEELLN